MSFWDEMYRASVDHPSPETERQRYFEPGSYQVLFMKAEVKTTIRGRPALICSFLELHPTPATKRAWVKYLDFASVEMQSTISQIKSLLAAIKKSPASKDELDLFTQHANIGSAPPFPLQQILRVEADRIPLPSGRDHTRLQFLASAGFREVAPTFRTCQG